MLAVGPLGPQDCWLFARYELGRQAHLYVDTLPSQRVPQKILKKSISLYYMYKLCLSEITNPSTRSFIRFLTEAELIGSDILVIPEVLESRKTSLRVLLKILNSILEVNMLSPSCVMINKSASSSTNPRSRPGKTCSCSTALFSIRHFIPHLCMWWAVLESTVQGFLYQN